MRVCVSSVLTAVTVEQCEISAAVVMNRSVVTSQVQLRFFCRLSAACFFLTPRALMSSERRDAARARSRCRHVRHFGDVGEPCAPGPDCTMRIPFWIIMCECLWLTDSKIACLLRRHSDMSALELQAQRKRCQGRN